MVTPVTELRGLNILITRPEGRNEELRAALQTAGAEVSVQPLLEILALPEEAPEWQQSRRYLMDLDLYQHLIFISVNAVEQGLQRIEDLWPQWPQGIQCYGIGAATRMALAESAHPLRVVDSADASDSESLLACAELQNVAGDSVLIVRGVGGRETLATKLRERGARVDYAECYQRRPAELSSEHLVQLLRERSINVVCLNSGETLQYFCERVGVERRGTLAAVVPGPRVASLAETAGFQQVICADNAGTAATLAALTQWLREKHVGTRR